MKNIDFYTPNKLIDGKLVWYLKNRKPYGYSGYTEKDASYWYGEIYSNVNDDKEGRTFRKRIYNRFVRADEDKDAYEALDKDNEKKREKKMNEMTSVPNTSTDVGVAADLHTEPYDKKKKRKKKKKIISHFSVTKKVMKKINNRNK